MRIPPVGPNQPTISLLQQVRADCEREFGRADRLTIAVGIDLYVAYNRTGRRREARALARVQRIGVRESEAAVAASLSSRTNLPAAKVRATDRVNRSAVETLARSTVGSLQDWD